MSFSDRIFEQRRIGETAALDSRVAELRAIDETSRRVTAAQRIVKIAAKLANVLQDQYYPLNADYSVNFYQSEYYARKPSRRSRQTGPNQATLVASEEISAWLLHHELSSPWSDPDNRAGPSYHADYKGIALGTDGRLYTFSHTFMSVSGSFVPESQYPRDVTASTMDMYDHRGEHQRTATSGAEISVLGVEELKSYYSTDGLESRLAELAVRGGVDATLFDE